MNNEKFHKNVDDIEFKCNELISEINDHLTLHCEPITTTSNNQQIVNDAENIIPDIVITSCHNKLINFALNHCEAKKIHKSQIIDADVVRIRVPKNICVNLTKINQLLIPHHPHQSDETDLLDSNLEIHHLKHVNIDPSLTKQVAFKISCPDERKSACRNVGTFHIIHENNSPKNASILKQPRNINLEKNQLGGDSDQTDETDETCEQNIDSEINIDATPPMSNEVYHFLFGNIGKKPSPNSKNKRSIKVVSKKIK